MAYKDIVPVGTVLILCATSFGLGVVYSNTAYDFHTLWRPTEAGFERSLIHYANWATAPMRVHHILHFVILLGLIGCFIKLYKPAEEVKYFEYGTLGMMMAAIIIYLTNLRIGANSCISGEWGDVDAYTGVNVMAASQFMMVIVLVGVLVLQGGLYYAEWYEKKIQREFLEKEAAAAAGPAAASQAPEATSSSVETKKSKAKKRV
ncbi:Shr3 amino acid permease chaperone [Metschnikowia bicuspidata var. bicuspidata NRRL YB-4993]|uniref:Shr3 amino acid permease chaperone n=1 Tax=Metschnikowia bicuspidata var. bicuspidata NRRL YB-4993 TaxID=869754 RepID=A0A1A0HEY9_9ASCO|nr:Shr3 amino acid permease chaperone [Metschnikowia bicuspidata var. bicuspidata NRRL YB-4993]OBA22566.1 Shr3 amino acid permease chaperone [Metschnikowia bicuspidata var. bicuspidata NRRL YB-4993]